MVLVLIYVAAVTAANLSVAAFGPPSVYVNAFIFIGLTLTTRDKLHEHWEGRNLALKMGAVIAAGALLSWILNREAGGIAAASVIAFIAAEGVDTTVYHLLRRRRWIMRSNASNFGGALVDSIVFPTLAFGAFIPGVVLGQFAAKVVGGLIWSVILHRKRESVPPQVQTASA